LVFVADMIHNLFLVAMLLCWSGSCLSEIVGDYQRGVLMDNKDAAHTFHGYTDSNMSITITYSLPLYDDLYVNAPLVCDEYSIDTSVCDAFIAEYKRLKIGHVDTNNPHFVPRSVLESGLSELSVQMLRSLVGMLNPRTCFDEGATESLRRNTRGRFTPAALHLWQNGKEGTHWRSAHHAHVPCGADLNWWVRAGHWHAVPMYTSQFNKGVAVARCAQDLAKFPFSCGVKNAMAGTCFDDYIPFCGAYLNATRVSDQSAADDASSASTGAGDCLAYTFGVDGFFNFEGYLHTHGCEVHTFDPSDESRVKNVKGESFMDDLYFHYVGVGSDSDPASHITNIFALIGYFDLDPNRVLDLALEVMEQQLWNASFLLLLKKFRRASIAHILGFKFVHYHTESAGAAAAGAAAGAVVEAPKSPRGVDKDKDKDKEAAPPPSLAPAPATPRSLCLLAATLLTAGLVDLDSLLSYLTPTLEETGKLMIKERTRLKHEIKTYGVVNLSSKASADSDKNKDKDKATSTALSPASRDFAGGNQVVGVVTALLLLKNWTLASEMARLFQVVAAVNVADYPDVASALIILISWSLDPVYQSVGMLSLGLAAPSTGTTQDSERGLPLTPRFGGDSSNANSQEVGGDMEVDGEESEGKTISCEQLEAITSLDSVVGTLKPLLLALGHHLSDSPDLFSRVCRVLKARMQNLRAAHSVVEVGGGAANVDEAALLVSPEFKDILMIISETLLPALTKLECNPALASLLWGLLSLLPFQVRFDMYRVWKGEGFGKQVSLACVILMPCSSVQSQCCVVSCRYCYCY
jgi:hypothetical protein